jgi:hypothetical protein
MTEYNPDNWIILKFSSSEYGDVYKVLAGWSGGYLDGSSWKLNSGITKIEDAGVNYHVYGYTNSVYILHKESELIRMNIAGVLSSFERQVAETQGASLKIVPITEVIDLLKSA